jgi:hypothetical protein
MVVVAVGRVQARMSDKLTQCCRGHDPMSAAQSVSRGFHRLGIFIAVVLFLNGLAIAVSLAVYGLVRTIGWVIGGFAAS